MGLTYPALPKCIKKKEISSNLVTCCGHVVWSSVESSDSLFVAWKGSISLHHSCREVSFTYYSGQAGGSHTPIRGAWVCLFKTCNYSWDRSLANLQSGCLGVCVCALKRKYKHLIWGAANFPVSLRASDLIARPAIIDVTMWGNMNSQKLETDQLNLNNQMYPANLEQESLQAQKVKTWNGTQRAKQNIGCIKRGKLDWNVPCSEVDKQLFRASTIVTVGIGKRASFWDSPWLGGHAPRVI
jgi:hypothetical protein